MTAPSIREYAALGWKLFPCHSIIDGVCSCGDQNCPSPGKHPRTFNGVKAATNSEKQLRAWYDQFPRANWALATGRASGVNVIDIDQRKGGFEAWDEYEQMRRHPGDFGKTLSADTGGGGRHLFIKAPNQTMRNRVNWLPGVDVRADGGYVILPPGTHISGGVYSWRNWGAHIMEAPPDWVTAVMTGSSISGDGKSIKDLSVDDFIDGIEEGSRDDTIFRMACKLRRQLNDNRAAVTLLCLQAAANSKPPFPEADALAKIDQAFKQDHTDIEAMIFSGAGNRDGLAHLTDMGNRDRFIQMYGDDYRYVVGMGWHKWADDGWHAVDELTPHRDAQEVPEVIRMEAQSVGDLELRTKMLNYATITESAAKINNILTLAKGHEAIKKQGDDFDNDPWALACANGMVDLRTGDIRPFTRDDLFTRNTRIVYDPDFKLQRWNDFLNQVTNGDEELAEYLQMAAGYTLSGSIAEECFFIVSGRKQTGKSTFTTAVESAMGSYADVSSAEVFMKRYGKEAPREELVKFAGARMITTEELPEGERFDDAFMKRITGGTKLSARYLYSEMFSYTPQFKIWMNTNHDPLTSDDAMFRRIKRILFMNTIPEDKRDRSLKAQLTDRSTGGRAVLAWAVEGARKYYEAGALKTPTSVLMATAAYQSEQDTFAHFMNETFFVQHGERIAETTAYQLHANWAKMNGERQMKRPQFAQKIREKNFEFVIDEETRTRYIMNIAVRAHTYIPGN